MKLPVFLIPLLFSGLIQGQVHFQTQVNKTIRENEPFMVQYVLDGVSNVDQVYKLRFPDVFVVVRGPMISEASVIGDGGHRKVFNINYTLKATRTGAVTIPGARIQADGRDISSDDLHIVIVSHDEDPQLPIPPPTFNDAFFLSPGEDPEEKIRKNLFVEVKVDRKSCFVGEPVVATFKLYSRLESNSDIVKNPGFYGFTVQDMSGLNQHAIQEETVKGKKFHVHTIRKVQLYALRAGTFTIDPMEVVNYVKFSRSIINKRTEQKIREGVLDPPASETTSGVETFETNMHTEPIEIAVRALPVKGQPDDFNGSTGKFVINAALENQHLARNEEGILKITISGKGNFTQLPAPAIDWPSGIEGFEPVVSDSLDVRQAPLRGSRTFTYRFVAARAGDYLLPATHFSFFDPDTNQYKTVATPSFAVHIDQRMKERVDTTTTQKKDIISFRLPFHPAYFWLTITVVLVLSGAYLTWRRENRSIKQAKVEEAEKPEPKTPLSEIMKSASILQGADDRTFFTALRQNIWDFFRDRFKLEGSRMNKYELAGVIRAHKPELPLAGELINILDECETGIFTQAATESDRTAIFDRTMNLLSQIDA